MQKQTPPEAVKVPQEQNLLHSSHTEVQQNEKAPRRQRKGLWFLIIPFMLLFLGLNSAQAQVTLSPEGNPSAIVPLGDHAVFSLNLYSGTAYTNAELDVTIPAGFELLTTTPNFKAGSLSGDKLRGRILVPSLPASTPLMVDIYVKALCNANTATPEGARKITYAFYATATAPTATATKTTESAITNILQPILNVTYPESKQVQLGATNTRVYTLIQTRNYSHINNLKVNVACDPTGLAMTKVEISRRGAGWTQLPAAALTSSASGYVYTISQSNLTALGYSGNHLNYSDTILVRETVILNTCGKGEATYTYFAGDGTTYCSDILNDGIVSYSEPLYTYTPDIWTVANALPTSPSKDGILRFAIKNNSFQAEAQIFNMYVDVYGGGLIYEKAYFVKADGSLDGYPTATDTVFIPWRGSRNVMFDSLSNPAMATWYAARGLSCLDGDGRYNDLERGNTVYFAVTYNYQLYTNCNSNLKGQATRRADLYYKTFCKLPAFTMFTRDYGNATSTNTWDGGFGFSELRSVTMADVNLASGDQSRLSFSTYMNGNGSVTGTSGSQLLGLAAGASPTSSFWSIVTLPKGLSFDASQANPVRIGSTNIPLANYTVSPTLDTIKLKWTSTAWGSNNYLMNIAVKANGIADASKTVSVYHEFDYGNTGTIQKFGCVSSPVGYVQLIDCSGLALQSFEALRTSWGYKDITRATKPASVAEAKSLGYNLKAAGPYDNVTMAAKTKAGSTIILGTNAKINVEVRYTAGARLLVMDPGKPTNTLMVWYNDVVTPIQVPAANVSYVDVANKRTLLADIAPALKNAGIGQINTNDSLRIEFYTQVTTAVSSIITTAGVSVEMEVTPVINNSPLTCYPLMDVMTLFNMNWGNRTTSSGGQSGTVFPQAWNHNTTTHIPAVELGIVWSYGGANPYTGGEYRPNGEDFTKIIVEYPILLKVNSVTRTAPGIIMGNHVAKAALDSALEYTVTYDAGKTYLTIDPGPKDMMSTGGSSGLGYRISMDVVNYNSANFGKNGNPQRVSFAFDNYPTSANPVRDTSARRAMAPEANGGTTPYPYTYKITPLLAKVSPLSSRAEWTLRITNQSNFLATDAKLPNSWIAVECPAGVRPVELRDAATNTPIAALFVPYADNKYWIQMGTVTANPDKDYILSCTYSICTGTPQLTVKYGMSKVDYPTDPAQGYANYNSPGVLAGVVSTTVSYVPPTVKFSGRLTHFPNQMNGTNQFCDTLTMNGEYTNGLASNINNLTLKMTLPAGFNYYPGWTPRVKFGNGAWKNARSASQTGRNLTILLSDTDELTAYGTATSVANVQFKLRMTCGIENGAQLPASFTGSSGCGAQITESVSSVSPIRIYGLQPPPDYWIKNLNLVQSIYVGASDTTRGTMTLTGQYELAESPSDDVKAIIDLPKNVVLTKVNSGSLFFVQEGTRLTATMPGPGSATIGSTYPIDIELEPRNPEQWGMDTTAIFVRTGKVNQLTCDGITCPLLEIGTRYDSVLVYMKKLQVVFSNDIKATSKYNDANSEHVVITGKLVNIGDVTAGRLTMDLMYFNGVDYVPVQNVISNSTTVNGVKAYDSTSFTITANVLYTEDVCSMVLILRKTNTTLGSVNPYLADSSFLVVPVPVYKILNDLDGFCQMVDNKIIGELPIKDYSYKWTPSHFLSKDNVARPYFNYDYENRPLANDTILKYAIEIKRPNQCVSVDTLYVPLKGIPYVQDIADMTLCSGSPFKIEFKDTTNTTPAFQTTYSWAIENGASVGLPISGTKSIIDVASVRNNTTQPIVLLCRVTPKKNGCDGITKIFTITVNPKPNINYMVDQSYCAGQMVAAQSLGGNLSNALYRWERVSGTAITGLTSGINIMPNFIASNSTTSATTTNFRAYAEYENADKTCYSDTVNFNIIIQPNPTVNTVGDKNICNGGNLAVNFTGTAAGSFYWEKVSGSNIPGLASNGTGNINLAGLTNATSSPLVAIYRVTPITASGTCMGSADNFTITLYPTVALSNEKNHTICSGEEFDLGLTSDVSNVIFTWNRITSAQINNGAAKTGSNAQIKEVLTSTATTAQQVKYAVTMKIGNCTSTDTIRVTVSPKPTITNIPSGAAVCSGSKFTFTPASNIAASNITWERLDATGIQESPSQGSGVVGTAKIDETLTNLTVNPITVTYVITIEKGGCQSTQQVRVTVNPEPTLSSTLYPNAICSGNTFTYSARSATKSVSFSWARVANASITPAAGSGSTATISETLTNTSANPVTVKYAVKMTANTCSNTDTVEVVVNPTPKLSSSKTPTAICSGDYFSYDITSATQGTNFTWRRVQNTDILEVPTNGVAASINEKLSVRSTSDVTVNYIITSEAHGCQNSGETVALLVRALPTVSITSGTPVSMAVNESRVINGATSGTVVGWTSSNTNVATVTGSGVNATVNAKGEGVAYITFKVKNANNCTNEVTFAVNVGAENTATLSLANGAMSEVCSGGSTTLEVSLTGGKAPFKVYYKRNDGGTLTNVNMTANSSVNRFAMTLPTNTTTAQKTVLYSLDSVVDDNNQKIRVLANTVSVTVNPTATISTTLAAQTTCQGALVSVPAFASSVSGVTYQWTNSNPGIGLGLSGQGNIATFEARNTFGAAISGDVTVTPVYTGLATCAGTPKNFTITVNPKPEFSVTNPAAICAGTAYNLNTNVASIITNVVPSGSTLKFYADKACTQEITTAVTPLQTTTYYVKATSPAPASCGSDVKEVILTVNPLPALNSAKTAGICSGETFSYTANSNLSNVSYTWSRAAVTTINSNNPASGSGAIINENLTSSASVAAVVKYIISMSANGCSKSDTVTVTVNPKPALNNIPANPTICSGSTFTYTNPASSVAATNITWMRQYSASINEVERAGTGTISEVLTNITVNPATVNYVFTLSAGGCSNEQTVRLVVNPLPELTSTLYPNAICSGSTFSYTARTQTKNATFAWKRLAAAGITPAPLGTPTASAAISEVLTNNTANPVTVKYEITTTANGCSNVEIVEVIVNPMPKLSSTKTPPPICSGRNFSYEIESATQGASFTWRRLQNSVIAEAPTNGGISLISEYLTASSQTDVLYRIITEANGCKSSGDTVKVRVNPLPTVSMITPTPVSMAVGNIRTVEATTNGTVVGWSSSNTNVADITQGSPATTAEIKAKSEGITYITLEVEDAVTGCKNTTSFAVNVGAENTATLTLASGSSAQLCSGSSTTLEMNITGGKAPFTVTYSIDGINQPTISATTSLYKFAVTPPANTTNAVKSVEYKLVSVIDANLQTVSLLGDPVVLQVYPVATVTVPADITLCEDASQQPINFTSNITDPTRVSYSWQNSEPSIGLPMSGKGSIPNFRATNPFAGDLVAAIEVTASYIGGNTCAGETKSFNITVKPKPEFIVVNPAAICQGASLDLAAKATEIVTNLSPAGTIAFYSNNIASLPVTTTGNLDQSTTFYVQTTTGSCKSDIMPVFVAVNEMPSLTSAKVANVCSGEEFSYSATSQISSGVSFTWERVVNGAINSGIGRSGSGANFKEIITSTATNVQTVIYKITMSANGCEKTDTVKLTVNPKPVLNNIPDLAGRTICSEASFKYLTPTINVAGATYTWERLYSASIDESPSSGINVGIDEKLTNLTANPITVTYVFTLQADGCPNTQEVRVVVNPTAVLSSTTYAGAICSGSKFSYTARTQTKGATYTWERMANTFISEAVSNGTTAGISETLTSTSNEPVTVYYKITTRANGCDNEEMVEVVVNPMPKLSSSKAPAAICSGDYFIYDVESSTQGANFTWRRLQNSAIAEAPTNGGSSLISERLTTTTGTEVLYRIITEANGCKNLGDTVKVRVNALPTVSMVSPTPVSMAVNGTTTVEAATNGTVVALNGWTSSNNNVVTVTQDAGDSKKAKLEAKAEGIAYITLQVENGSGCTNAVTFAVNVGAENTATLALATGSLSQLCNGSSTTLEVSMSGGKTPFTVNYEENGVPKSITATTSNFKFAVTPPDNTSNDVETASYKLTGVTDRAGQTITLLGDPVVVQVYPKALVSNTFAPITLCEEESQSAISFNTNIADASKVSYSWQNSEPSIGLPISGRGSLPSFRAANPFGTALPATISVTAYYNGVMTCEGETKTFDITVNPKPEFIVMDPAAICQGSSIDLNAKATEIVTNLSPAGNIKFYTDRNKTTEVVTAQTLTQSTTFYVQSTSTVGSCMSNVEPVFVAVNEMPRLNSAKALEICSGDELSYSATSSVSMGVSFTWERVANAAINGGAARNGSGANFKEVITSTSTAVEKVIYKITMSANGCEKTDTLTLTVNPKPTLNNIPVLADRTICSESNFVYAAPASDVAGTTITWERLYSASIDESPNSGSGGINEKLTNLTANPVTVTYVFTLQANGCPNTQEVRVIVNPTAVLSSATYAGSVCSGSKFSYTARTQTKGATYAWTRLTTTGISEAAGSGNTNAITETLTNTTTDPITVQYEITTTANGCSNTEIVEVTLNPMPKLSNTVAADICSGESFVFTIGSATADARFSWYRKNNTGIAEAASYGSSSLISEKLTNKTNSAVTVEYVIISEANGCKNTGETVSVVVNPLPIVTITTATPIEMNVNGIREVTSVISAGATVIGWTSSNSYVAEVTKDAGDATKASIKAKAQGITTITLEIESAEGCRNTAMFTVNVGAEVKASLVLANNAASQICNNGSTTLEVNITGGKAPFAVYYKEGTTVKTLIANSSNHRFEVMPPANTGDAPAITTYTLDSVRDDDGQKVTVLPNPVNITVNPVAKITNTNIAANTEFCQGGLVKMPAFETNITDKNKVTYSWTNTNPNIGLGISGQGALPVFEAKNGYGHAIEGDITVTATYNGLASCQDVTTAKTFKITINPRPEFMVTYPDAICAGSTIDLNANASTIVHTVVPSTCNIEFYNEASCVTPVTAAVAPTRDRTYYVRAVEPTTGCVSLPQPVVVTVNTVPTVDDIEDQTLCNGSGLNLQLTGSLPGTVYKWVRTDANANVTGLPVSGTGTVYSNRLGNATTDPQTITIKVTPEHTANGVTCTGTDMIFDITVNPTPKLNVPLTVTGICNGGNPNYTLGSATANINYYWERTYVEGIAEGILHGTGNVISETLTNLTQKTIHVRYAVTMEIGNCTNVQYVTVPVYPTPLLSSPLNAGKICSGSTFSYMGQSAVTGATIQWKRLANASIAEAASNTLAPMPVNEVLTNTTTSIAKVQYEVTTTANGCSNTETVEMYVGPKLQLSSTLTPADICSGKYFNYTATAGAAGVLFSWTRDFNADIQPADASGNSAKINERLVNLTDAAVPVTYNITMRTVEGCEATEQISFMVNPLPVISASESPVTIAMGGTRVITINDAIVANGSVVSSKPAIATATFNTANGEMTIHAVKAGYTELTYTTANATGCINTLVIPVTVTDGPTATIALAGANTTCSGGQTTVQITDIMNGKGPWTIEINYAGSNDPGQVVTVSHRQELPLLVDITLPGNSNNAHRTVTYKVTNVTDDDGATRVTHIGMANVVELPVPTVDQVFDQEICNGTYTDAVYFTGAATNYRWSVDKSIGLSRIGQGDIVSFLASHSQLLDLTATITVTPEYTYNNVTCVGTTPITFSIKVKTIPVIAPLTETQICSNATELYIPYTTADTSLEYRVVFSEKALDAGFYSMTNFMPMPKDSIKILMAEGVTPQRYRGTIDVRHTGCSSFSSYDFTIYVLKELAIEQQPVSETVVCETTTAFSLNVKATGIDLTYQWYRDGQPISGATQATYSQPNLTAVDYGKYHVEVSSKCGIVSSDTAVVRLNEAMIHQKWDDILYVSNRDTSGNSLQFHKYQWYKATADGRMIPVSLEADVQDYQERGGLNGTYAVEIFYINGTSRMSCPYTVVSAPKVSFKVYPNPVKAGETVNVSLEKAENNGNLLEVFDVNGKRILSVVTKEEVTPLSLDVPSGTYVLRVTDPKGQMKVQKIIVK